MTIQGNGVVLYYRDTDGTLIPTKIIDGKTRVSSMPYLYDIAEGNVEGHTPWSKIGFTPTIVANTESDIWSKGGVYTFCTTPGIWEVVSSDNTQDIGTAIKSGTSTGGSTTTLIDSGANFNSATAVAAGDCVVLDPTGTTPEWGYVTTVSSNTQLTIAGGFSSRGTGSGRAYSVVDRSAYTGAQVVKVEYLTSTFVEKSCIIVLNGTTPVNGPNDFYRVNSFRVIATGSGLACVGNLTLQADGAGAVYSYITAGNLRARNTIFTIPAGKTLYVTSIVLSYAYSHNSTHYARVYTRGNAEPSTGFISDSLFYPYSEVICSNTTVVRQLETPTKFSSGVDMKSSVLADYAGVATAAYKGWLETA